MRLDQLFSLKGQAALVTGSGAGIGKAICPMFAEAGADVACTDLKLADAETVAGATPDQIRRVFGFTEKGSASNGSVVFYDSWPNVWPKLTTDILNSHHPEYYQKQNEPPGDWEDPVPVYFLSVPAGRTLTIGEEVELVINSVNPANKQIAFKWSV